MKQDISGDRELLELAAMAVGIQTKRWNDGNEPYSSGQGFILEGNSLWNPLTDDGDALRLVVKLGMDIIFYEIEVEVIATYHGNDDDCLSPRAIETKSPDPLAATRRAIVRAAAEIGRKLEGGAK